MHRALAGLQQTQSLGRALSDPARIRTLAALAGGELCLCQIVELLDLAPSTLSRHMNVLVTAGLVLRRKQGRWHYFRLAGEDAPEPTRAALGWTLETVRDDPDVQDDARRLDKIRRMNLTEVSACCYRNG